jgi:hypothetical protein
MFGNRCLSCIHYDELVPGWPTPGVGTLSACGLCKRRPPQVHTLLTEKPIEATAHICSDAIWPRVRPADRCGEFFPRDLTVVRCGTCFWYDKDADDEGNGSCTVLPPGEEAVETNCLADARCGRWSPLGMKEKP